MYSMCNLCSEQKRLLYNGMFPIYDSFGDVMKPVDVFDAVLNTDLSSTSICTKKPVGVTDAAVFIVDTTKLRHQDDLKADDMGSWTHKGKPIHFYKVQCLSSGEVYDAQLCDSTDDDRIYKLTRIYYHHKGTTEFRKTLFYIHGKCVIAVWFVVTNTNSHGDGTVKHLILLFTFGLFRLQGETIATSCSSVFLPIWKETSNQGCTSW